MPLSKDLYYVDTFIYSILAVSDGLESTFSDLKKKKKKAMSYHAICVEHVESFFKVPDSRLTMLNYFRCRLV